MDKPIVIAIDGPAGAGKSTVAKEVARRLGFMYLDTGAMYRSLTLKALRHHVDLTHEDQLVELARSTTIDLQIDKEHALKVFLDGADVTEEIRTAEVTNSTFYIARLGRVREVMVERQRAIGNAANVVAVGRDIGTVVFPHAYKKFYLDANFEERVNRRFKEMKGKGVSAESQDVHNDLQERDTKDFTRKVGPLKKADDAIVIDSTHMSIPEVVQKVIEAVNEAKTCGM
ncbi:MAG: (d)CMP kinase [Candidatus Omnitrophica bacterium]|nr:(d)CMP kinase [Candidatus Omnitrophota bacterium]